MDLFTAIDTRASSIKLTEPAPSKSQIERLLTAAVRAPDHGKLAPWRFVVLQGESRHVLANAMAESFLASNPAATVTQLDGERAKPLRAPAIVTVAARINKGHKVPEHEQIQAVAAAVQNMFLAAHAMGLGAMWKTGAATESSIVKRALGLDEADVIVAFLYVGTNATPGPQRAAVLEGLVRWLD
jgi:nitroreductase